jgi:hypothetical protein
MYKLYSVTNKKTGILGFWRDENGKVFRDKIKIKTFCALPRKDIAKLFLQGEKSVFYTSDDKIAVCLNSDYTKKALCHCIKWNEKKLRPQFIKELILQHNGVTIYKNENDFTFEIWRE